MKPETPPFNIIRHELNKLEEMPAWGRRQGDQWDKLSDFVYRTKTLRGAARQAQAVANANGINSQLFENYALRRWYNHHTHDQILQMFYAHSNVRAQENAKHQSIDFYLRDIPFDLKISSFPKAYPQTIKYAWQHRHHLAEWQYQNQSKQRRYHTGNRLFIMLHHRQQPELTWQLRRDFEMLETLIAEFLNAPTLLGLTITNYHTQQRYHPWAGMIFYIK